MGEIGSTDQSRTGMISGENRVGETTTPCGATKMGENVGFAPTKKIYSRASKAAHKGLASQARSSLVFRYFYRALPDHGPEPCFLFPL